MRTHTKGLVFKVIALLVFTINVTFAAISLESSEENTERFQSKEVQSGWKYSSWLGYFYDPPGDWIYHSDFGWLYVGEDTNQSIWIFAESTGWTWTSPNTYPFLWTDDGKEWLYFDSRQKRTYSYLREKWLGFQEYSNPENANNSEAARLAETQRKQEEAARLAEIARQQAEADRLAEIARQQSNVRWNIPIERNPKYSYDINPKYSYEINPKYSYDINPKYSYDINPKYSYNINPKYNYDINPKYNYDINPEYNSSIDPRWNNWYGNFLFDKDAEFKGVIVHVNNSFKLWFDQNGQWIGFFVYNSKSGFNLFDKDDTWLGYILPNGAGNWNLFDTEGEWAGFTT